MSDQTRTGYVGLRTRLTPMAAALAGVVALLALPPAGARAEDSAVDWLRRSQAARFPGRDMRAGFVMYIEQKNGPRLKRRGLALRRNRDADLADRLFVVHAPENLKELALLSQDQAGAPAAAPSPARSPAPGW